MAKVDLGYSFDKSLALHDPACAQLKAEGVYVASLLATYRTAVAKKERISAGVSQSGKKFTITDKSEVKRDMLLDAEDFALQLVAFAKHQEKAMGTWGQFPFAFPHSMLENARKIWPVNARVETPEPEVQATA